MPTVLTPAYDIWIISSPPTQENFNDDQLSIGAIDNIVAFLDFSANFPQPVEIYTEAILTVHLAEPPPPGVDLYLQTKRVNSNYHAAPEETWQSWGDPDGSKSQGDPVYTQPGPNGVYSVNVTTHVNNWFFFPATHKQFHLTSTIPGQSSHQLGLRIHGRLSDNEGKRPSLRLTV